MITKEDYQCPICLGIFVQPCKLNCNHIFCQTCLNELIDFNLLEYNCPMCRQKQTNDQPLKIDQELDLVIQQHFPELYQKRQIEIQQKLELNPDQIKIKIKYGNYHQFYEQHSENQHKWSLFVELDYISIQDKQKLLNQNLNQLIKKVEYQLDETYFPDSITCREPPFKLERWGYDVFTIPIKIKFLKKLDIPPIEIEHHLIFDQDYCCKCQVKTICVSQILMHQDDQIQKQQYQ